jgi:hypothetical protein
MAEIDDFLAGEKSGVLKERDRVRQRLRQEAEEWPRIAAHFYRLLRWLEKGE